MKNFLLGVMITALCLVATGANYQDDGPTNYEYKVVLESAVAVQVTTAETTNFLNKEGANGWKLISVNRSGPELQRPWYFFFEREKR
jgi:uncharacterized protein YcfL